MLLILQVLLKDRLLEYDEQEIVNERTSILRTVQNGWNAEVVFCSRGHLRKVRLDNSDESDLTLALQTNSQAS